MKRFLLFLSLLVFAWLTLILALPAFGQVESVTVNANGDVLNTKPIDFPAGKLESNHVTIETLLADKVSDTGFAASWNGVLTIAPSKNAVYDWSHTFDTDDDGKVNVLDQAAGIPLTDTNGVLLSPITDNSLNWNTAYTDRLKWDGGATGLIAATGRTSLELGTLATQSGTFSGTSSGTNTGDNAINSLYSGLVSNATHTGDVTGATALTLVTAQPAVHTWALAQTFTVAPIFTDQSGTRTALGLGSLATQSGTFSGTSSGTNTGDNSVNSLYSGLVSNATHTGDVTGATALTLATAQPAVHTWALGQTFTVAPIFTDAPGSRTALGLGTAATTASSAYDAAGSAAAVISDTAYNATSWDGVTTIAPSKNAVRDKIESLTAPSSVISDTAYDATLWDGVTGIAPSKNAVRDKLETLGSAAYTASGSYATSTQGTTADNAMPKTGGTFVGNILFTDNTYDIGASAATRPRDFFLARNAVIGGTLSVTGTTTLGTLAVTTITQDAYTAPTLLNSWTNFGSGQQTAGYMKDREGFVHLRGLITGGTTTSGTSLLVLPSGYRPTAVEYFSVVSAGLFSSVLVDASGNVQLNVLSGSNISLSGIIFSVNN